jgi:hypothetical protein
MVQVGSQAIIKLFSRTNQAHVKFLLRKRRHPPINNATHVTKPNGESKAMQPYEIRQFSDGTIDYNAYYARPISLLTPNMYRFCRQATSLKTALIVVTTVGALMFAASASTHRTVCANCAPAKVSLLVYR